MLSFIDISGDFNANPVTNKYIVASSVTIKRSAIADLNRRFHNLKRDILLNETLEIKSTSYANRDTLGDRTKSKHQFSDQFFNWCIDNPDSYYSSIIIQNENIKPQFPRERLSKHYIYLLQRINKIAYQQHCSKVTVIIDNNSRKVDKWSAYAFNNYLYRTINGRDLDRILEVPIFADSEMTSGIQIADMVAGVIRHYYSEGLNESVPESQDGIYHIKLREYFDIINNHTPNFGSMKGMYIAPPNFLSEYYTL